MASVPNFSKSGFQVQFKTGLDTTFQTSRNNLIEINFFDNETVHQFRRNIDSYLLMISMLRCWKYGWIPENVSNAGIIMYAVKAIDNCIGK